MADSNPCDNCGHVLKPTAKFCGKCGAAVSEVDKPIETKPTKQKLIDVNVGIVSTMRVGKDASRRYVKGSYHTKLTDTRQLSEIEKIADRLDPGENVLYVARQSKNIIKSGHSLLTPDTLIATDQKLILRNPSALGLRQVLKVFRYDTITDLALERGAFSAALDVHMPGEGVHHIDAIKKNDAEQILRIYQDAIQKIRGLKQSADVEKSSSVSDELAKLAVLRNQEIISEEEFQESKRALLSKL
jgi:hypothetical protein